MTKFEPVKTEILYCSTCGTEREVLIFSDGLVCSDCLMNVSKQPENKNLAKQRELF